MTVPVGFSGFSAYLPPYRVNLDEWCCWTASDAAKTSNVVGDSFRMCGPRENVYTMAANAVLRLIRTHDVDPSRVGMLALGTESSTDNSAGAVIVRGMVDDALHAEGLPALSRQCEVPEFKHACLGGMYAIKSALRYLAVDGADRQAIVVSADIAEYARGSSGEPTQGAGAVAALLEAHPKMLVAELRGAASASAYRGPDFRKPFSRFRQQAGGHRLQDFPVFNGKYSTTCYLDETLSAMRAAVQLDPDMQNGATTRAQDYLDRYHAVFLHRPYQRMPETGWATMVLALLAGGGSKDRALLAELCDLARVCPADLRDELKYSPDVFALVREGALDREVYPLAQTVVRAFRGTNLYGELVSAKLSLGQGVMRRVGNLYSAALPAWIAAGLEEAAQHHHDLSGRRLLAIGYGSGDAAEVLPLCVAPEWRDRATRTVFEHALADPVDLDESAYQRLHDFGRTECRGGHRGFFIERIGVAGPAFDESGIESYGYRPEH